MTHAPAQVILENACAEQLRRKRYKQEGSRFLHSVLFGLSKNEQVINYKALSSLFFCVGFVAFRI